MDKVYRIIYYKPDKVTPEIDFIVVVDSKFDIFNRDYGIKKQLKIFKESEFWCVIKPELWTSEDWAPISKYRNKAYAKELTNIKYLNILYN